VDGVENFREWRRGQADLEFWIVELEDGN